MNTSRVFADVFIARTTGRRAIFKVNNLTLEAVKVVLKGIQLSFDEDGAMQDLKNGFLLKQHNSGFYGGADGYVPTAKGFRKILEELS